MKVFVLGDQELTDLVKNAVQEGIEAAGEIQISFVPAPEAPEAEAEIPEPEQVPEQPREILVKAMGAVEAAAAAHGEEFLKEVFELFPSRNLNELSDEDLGDLCETLAAGPDEETSAEPVEAETVKEALRQFARASGQKNARALMEEHRVRSMTAIDDLSADALSAFYQAITAGSEGGE